MNAWPRVTRRNPCHICGKVDWCGISEDGRHAICMRVESDHPTRNSGWLHNLSGQLLERPKSVAPNRDQPLKARFDSSPAHQIDCDALLNHWRQSQNGQLEPFEATLGVSQASLRALGCVWASEHRAYAFPMLDASLRTVGIRLRNDLGRKWAVTGSRQGLFLSGSGITTERNRVKSRFEMEPQSTTESPEAGTISGTLSAQTLLIVEGPTDAAAAIDLGYAVIGRPACVGCEDEIVKLVRESGHVTTVIIADADEPGQRGATKLQAMLRKAKIVTLPSKDLRSFLNSGGTRTIFEQIIAAAL